MAAVICDFEDGASPSSVTDASEDSVEVKVGPVVMPSMAASICTRKNKRKSSEPRRLKDSSTVQRDVDGAGHGLSNGLCKKSSIPSSSSSSSSSSPSPSFPVSAYHEVMDSSDGERHSGNDLLLGAETAKQLKRTSGSDVYRHAPHIPRPLSDVVVNLRRKGQLLPARGAGDAGFTVSSDGESDANGAAEKLRPGVRLDNAYGSGAISSYDHLVPPPTGASSPNFRQSTAVSNKDTINNFALNLPFDVRNILGPSASMLLSQSLPVNYGRFRSDGHQTRPQHQAHGDGLSDSIQFVNRTTVSQRTQDGDSANRETMTSSRQSQLSNHGPSCSSRTLPERPSRSSDHLGDNGQSVGLPSSSSLAAVQCFTDPGESGGESRASVSGSCRQKQRNYKNMTRERRMEANARERTRVHTISAAFENLRSAVPSYSCHQKLSKLAILRIACSYILTLGTLNDVDYSSQQDGPSLAECVDLCTSTIQTEGKARKRKAARNRYQVASIVLSIPIGVKKICRAMSFSGKVEQKFTSTGFTAAIHWIGASLFVFLCSFASVNE